MESDRIERYDLQEIRKQKLISNNELAPTRLQDSNKINVSAI
jgi:hypothetical protein